jgi:C-terminal processing protease CtpA/Prc
MIEQEVLVNILLSLKDLPYVKIVGDRTEGILGGSKIGFLPYGWIYGVNKWKVNSRHGVWYEDMGIPPDYLIQNKIGNLKNGIDPLIEKAIEIFEN